MNKQTFLNELEKELASLSIEERADIMRDMEEYFHEGQLRGRVEEEIIARMGSPKILSETIIVETKVKRIQKASSILAKFTALSAAIFAILVLAPFNLIFVLLPLMIITFFIAIGWLVILLLMISLPVVWLINLSMGLFVGFNIFALLSLLFFAIGWSVMVFVIALGFSYLTIYYFKGIARLLMWNINFIKRRAKG